MAVAASAPPVVRFGVFEVDLGAGELRKKGVRVRLQEQPLQVLALLLEQPGRVVTREDLKRRLWPGTVVDFDHGLNTTIAKLREALGDEASTPRFIETLPRRGYRFIHPLDGMPVEVIEPPASQRRRWPVGAALGGLTAVLVGLLALGVGGLRERRSDGPSIEIASIAVLPLENLSGDSRQDHFVDGMTEAVIAELGKIGALRVLAYRSAVAYRGTGKRLPEIAREVDVDAILTGTVIHSGDGVRVTARLFQASPERQLWEESYAFDVRDVLAMQKELARDVAGRIRVKVTPREQVRLAYARRVDPKAYQAYLLGRAHLARTPTPASWARAKEYFERAIEGDPGHAPAYAGLAELLIRQRGSSTRSAGANRIQARQWVEQALELDDTLAEAHMTLARVAQQEWDFAAAERAYRRAIELNPSSAQARIWYAQYLYGMQRFDQAAAEARRAQQLDPASAHVNTWAGAAYLFAGQAEEARASWQKALELDPGYADASLVIARTHVSEGRYREAIEELRRALRLNEGQALLLGALAHAHARADQREEALKVVGELRRLEAEERGYVPPFGMIWAWAGLGDRDRAFALLERAYQDRIDRMVWLNVDPLLEPLRSDPRFEDLARRMGLPPRPLAKGESPSLR
jgi:TolB-like protein/DNA-binding winged helix-turn-helix (wHTH) protein/Tfp pilus assembly protein PilF